MNTQEILEALWPLRAMLQGFRARGIVFPACGARFLYGSDDLINLKLALVGAHEFETTHIVQSRLKPSDVFIDIGANLGYFSILAGRKLTRGQVIAVEPSSRNQAALQANIELNELRNVRRVQRILWRESGKQLELHIIDPYNSGASSILGSGPIEAAGVSITLDDLVAELGLDRVDVIKIDVEGAELDVLEGGTQCLHKLKPRLLIVAADHPDEPVRRKATRLISAAGYQQTDPLSAAVLEAQDHVDRALFVWERCRRDTRHSRAR